MFEKFKSWIRRYFGFSRTETNGFVVLVLLFPIILFSPVFLKLVIKQNTHGASLNTQQLDSLVTLMEGKIAFSKKAKTISEGTRKIKLTRFNPNTAKYGELLQLGITAKIAGRIINYRRKGGSFVVKDDLKKIYGLTENEFKRLKYYIDLPDHRRQRDKTQHGEKGATHVRDIVLSQKFDVNAVDTAQLRSIKGIGSILSGRIVKFRNGLGGFITVEQMGEVYGLSPEVFKLLKERGYVEGQFRPKLINVNEASADDISRHPYITKKLANQIVKYRGQHGKFENLEQLMNIHVIDKNWYDKLKPYLTL